MEQNPNRQQKTFPACEALYYLCFSSASRGLYSSAQAWRENIPGSRSFLSLVAQNVFCRLCLLCPAALSLLSSEERCGVWARLLWDGEHRPPDGSSNRFRVKYTRQSFKFEHTIILDEMRRMLIPRMHQGNTRGL